MKTKWSTTTTSPNRMVTNDESETLGPHLTQSGECRVSAQSRFGFPVWAVDWELRLKLGQA